MLTGIVVALPEEINTLTKQKIVRGGCAFVSENILVTLAGTGPLNAGNAVNLLKQKGVKRIVSWGCAAALQPSLQPGSLTLPSFIIGEDQQGISLQSAWHQHAEKVLANDLAASATVLVERCSIIASSIEKQAIHAETKADVLDMESFAVAKAAQAENLPCLIVRAVADPVDMDLPHAISHALNHQGEIEIGKLLTYLLKHPAQLLGVIRLGVHFHAATRTLKSVAKQLEKLFDVSYTLRNTL